MRRQAFLTSLCVIGLLNCSDSRSSLQRESDGEARLKAEGANTGKIDTSGQKLNHLTAHDSSATETIVDTTHRPGPAQRIASSQTARQIDRRFFGMTFSRLGSLFEGDNRTRYPDHLGHGSVRLHDCRLRGHSLRPKEAAPWYFGHFDELVALHNAYGSEILYVFAHVPRWSSVRTYAAANGLEPDDPAVGSWAAADASAFNPYPADSIETWIEYVSQVVKRYRGRIHAYQLLNEINFEEQWAGSLAEAHRYVTAATPVIRALDPQALIVAPSFTNYRHKPPPDNALVEKDIRVFYSLGPVDVDVVSVHSYNRPQTHTGAWMSVSPEDTYRTLLRLRTVLDEAGFEGYPLWDTEWNQSYGGRVDDTEEKGAAWISRAYLARLMAGIDRTFYYAFDIDSRGPDLSVGANHKRLTKAGKAFGQLADFLGGKTLESILERPRGLFRLEMSDSLNRKSIVAWSAQEKETTLVDLQVAADTVVIDLIGGLETGRSIRTGDSVQAEVGSMPILIYDSRRR